MTGVRLRQIVVKITFQSLLGGLLNHLYHYTNENVSVKRLSVSQIETDSCKNNFSKFVGRPFKSRLSLHK